MLKQCKLLSTYIIDKVSFSHGTGTLRCLQKEMATYRHWSVSLWRDPDDVSHQLTVPRHCLSTYGRRAFAVAGPTMFNTLPDDLRDPAVSTSTFSRWRLIFSLPISTFSALGVSHVMRYINVRYLLTYYCRILSSDKTEWRLILATLCGWRRCFVADQLWFTTRIREE